MNKENVIDMIDEIVPKEKQIQVDIPTAQLDSRATVREDDDYHAMIKDLILMALPSPSQHLH